jgi:ribosomal protein S27AE
MAENQQAAIRMRCPVCFSRENDVVLLQEGARYYCPKCGFHGTETDVWDMYADLRKKYRLITTRVTLEEQRAM